MPERHVAELLAEIFRRSGMKRAVRRAEAVLLWPQVVGADVARFAEAKVVREGVLYVDVSDSETAMHLSLQRQRFLDVYRARFASREIKDIRFRVGRVRPPDPEEAAETRPGRPDPEDLASLARSLGAMDLPEDVAGAAMRAGRALLGYRARRLADGWTPCPTCGVLCEEDGLCPACRRYAGNGRVAAAARLLAVRPVAPTPELGEQERAVAEHLAARSLDATLDELLPQVIADPALKPQLERAARCRAALATGKAPDSVQESDMDALPARVRRVLGVL